MKRPCLDPDCPRLVDSPESRCELHRTQERAGRKARGLTGKRGSTHRWRKLRRRALERDGYRCVDCDAPYPLEVDHVNGDPSDDRLVNLATRCVRCHHAKHANLPAQNRSDPIPGNSFSDKITPSN